MLACPWCAGDNVPDAIYCGSCGTVLRALATPPRWHLPYEESYERSPARAGLPVAGGALTIAGGGVGATTSLFTFFGMSSPLLGFGTAICGLTGLLFGTLAVLGGILAILRRQWGLALAGSILGIFSGGILFIASILCFVGLVFVGASDRQFTS